MLETAPKRVVGRPFQAGQSGNPNGRPKKLVKRPDEALAAAGKDPVAEILALIASGELRASDQLKAWLELLAYCHAKPKEFAVAPDPFEGLSDKDLLKLVKEKIPELEKGA